jgi:endonuclease/exonuclease/phosphatase family metal-dependent hydrolase
MRLLTWNIHKGIGGVDRRYDLTRIFEAIRHEQPDLVCLQEVDHFVRRSRHHDQPELLARELGFPVRTYQLNVKLKEGGYGNLILSRWEFATKHQISLKLGWRKSRGAQIVVVDTPAGRLRLVNWHLGLAEHERHYQARHLVEHPLFREGAAHPSVVAGDTNDWRDTLTRGVFQPASFRQVTHPLSRFRTFPAWAGLGALDKVFVCERVQVERVHAVRTQLTRRASDHLPIVIDFGIDRG